jgi:hypothetical protein
LWETIGHSVDFCNGGISEENEAMIYSNFIVVNSLGFSFLNNHIFFFNSPSLTYFNEKYSWIQNQIQFYFAIFCTTASSFLPTD